MAFFDGSVLLGYPFGICIITMNMVYLAVYED